MNRNFKYEEKRLDEAAMLEYCAPFIPKMVWFASKGYFPHYYQQLFHSLHGDDEHILPQRHLVAGRRGGKTLAAAWELLYYVLHPEFFHWDVHGKKDDRPLYSWVLFKDNPTGMAAWTEFRRVLKESGLTHGVEYKENRSNRWFEFENGGFVHFRTAEDPESLRGAGLDIMWIDEAAFIPNVRAWEVSEPAISDKEGILITSSTPSGKNWFYETFWNDEALKDNDIGRVEYRTIDNPFYPRARWDRLARTMHPMIFRQEMMAAFDAFQGRELMADWLKYYTLGEERDDMIAVPRQKDNPKKFDLTLYMGVDPAISLSDRADKFAMVLLGVTKDHLQVFVLDIYADRIPFPEQVDKIKEWHLKYRPSLIGIESNAYQAALAQQVMRLETLPPVVPIISGQKKKPERILGMAPLFRIGKVRVRKEQRAFIDEWLDYDSQIKNPKDDILDAVEITLQTAGALLPDLPDVDIFDDKPVTDFNEWARRDLPKNYRREDYGFFDEMMGANW